MPLSTALRGVEWPDPWKLSSQKVGENTANLDTSCDAMVGTFAVSPVLGSFPVSRTRGDRHPCSPPPRVRFGSTVTRRVRSSHVQWRASREKSADSSSSDDRTATPSDNTPSFAEARQKFASDFWNEVGENQGGVPFLKERKGLREGDETGVQGDSTGDGKEGKKTEHEKSNLSPSSGFWSKCTVIGFVLFIWFGMWGLSTVHWPTVAWTIKNPNALAWSNELGWSVINELSKRLGAPILRLITSWCALRSNWKTGFTAGFLSFVVPEVG